MDRRIPIALALLALPAAAAAQIAPPASGVTVTGRGSVTRPADAARVTVTFTNGLTSSDRTDAAIHLLQAAGAADAAVAFNGQSVTNPVVAGTLRRPTVETLRALARDVAGLAGNGTPTPGPVPGPAGAMPRFVSPGTFLNYTLVASDCGAEITRAQNAAFEDARTHAESVARTAGVRLGAITAIAVLGVASPGCTGSGGVGPGPIGYTPVDVGRPFDLTINATVTLTYAIVPNAQRLPQ